FQTIAGFATGFPDWQTRTLDTGAVHADMNEYGAFVQDTWRATSALTLDVGVRYDLQAFTEGLPARNRTDWAPRVGLAFAPGGRKNVFRGAYGLFYGTTPAMIPALARAFSQVDVHTAPASIAVIDPSFKTARVHQASAGWEVEKYRAGSLGVDYLFARGERLPSVVNVNATTPPLRRSYRYIAFQSTAESIYKRVTLHARSRVLHQLFYTIAYTVARSDES